MVISARPMFVPGPHARRLGLGSFAAGSQFFYGSPSRRLPCRSCHDVI